MPERSIDDMKRDGEAYIASSGVALKFDLEDTEVDWNKSFTWNDCEMIVDRYADEVHPQI